MPQIQIKYESQHVTNLQILQILSKHNIKCLNVIKKNNSFSVKCHDDSDVDKIFGVTCVKELQSIKCSPILPPKIKSKRSVLLTRCDQLILQNNLPEIKQELNNCNPGIEVDSVFKIPNSKTIKLSFKSQEMANSVLNNGIFLFNLYVPSHFIKAEIFVEINTCLRCYKIENHTTSQCPQNSDFKVCSLCSSNTHRHHACTSSTLRCLNCQGPHSSTSSTCPTRKEIITNKRKSLSQASFNNSTPTSSYDNSTRTYASVTSAQTSNFSETIAKSSLCLLIASAKEFESKGSFQQTLNYLLKENGLPNFSMGNISPPQLSTLLHQSASSNRIEDGLASLLPPSKPAADNSSTNNTKNDRPIKPHSPVLTRSQQSKKSQLSVPQNSKPYGITIYKKKGSFNVSSENFKLLLSNDNIKINSKLQPEQCISLLSAHINIADIIELPPKEFNAVASASIYYNLTNQDKHLT